jgi:hypothetical protein
MYIRPIYQLSTLLLENPCKRLFCFKGRFLSAWRISDTEGVMGKETNLISADEAPIST